MRRLWHSLGSYSSSGSVPSQHLKGGVLETLKVCAQYGPQGGATDSQIAVMTSYKATSRKTFRSSLISAGLIRQAGNGWEATPEGIAALGTDYEPLPVGAELQQYWRQRLTGGELKCFEALVAAYPEELTNEQLMEVAGCKQTSVKTFKSSLRARCLIEGNRASSNLFD